jgi:hypothetical protein
MTANTLAMELFHVPSTSRSLMNIPLVPDKKNDCCFRSLLELLETAAQLLTDFAFRDVGAKPL